MKYKAILFDLDGTLLDSVNVILKTAKKVFGTMGIIYDETDLRKSIGVPLKVQAMRYCGDRAGEFTDLYRKEYSKNSAEDGRVFPYTLEMLNALRTQGYTTALVTSKSTTTAKWAIEHTGMTGKFDVIVTADDVEHPKPHPQPILKALEILKVKPEEAIYIGDSLFDVDAAQKAKVTMVGVTWGARSKEDMQSMCVDHIIDSWKEFLVWLSGSSDPRLLK